MKHLDLIHNSIGFYIGEISRKLKNSMSRAFAENGFMITPEQMHILMILWNKDGISQNILTKKSNKEKATITRIINGLEKKQFINRVQCTNDKRNNKIFLTEKAVQLKDKLIPIALDVILQTTIDIDDNELVNTQNTLIKILNNIENLNSKNA